MLRLARRWGLVVALVGLVALGGAVAAAVGVQADPVAVGLVTDEATLADMGWNWLAYQGLLRAEADLGVVGTVYTSTSGADYEPNLQKCVTDGNDLCLAVGFLMTAAVSNTAASFPATDFAFVDAILDHYPDNLRSMIFAEDEAGYLAGTLAGLMTASDVVGDIGGWPVPPVVRFVEGYRHGVLCANPAATVLISYTNDFANPDLGAQVAQEMIAQGADVIFAPAGGTGTGAVLTATQSAVWGIGVDSDYYYSVFDGGAVAGAGYLLSSAMKRVDNVVYDTIADEVNGAFTSGEVLYDLAAQGVGLAPFHEAEPFVPLGVQNALDRVGYGIAHGLIDVWGPCPVITVGVGASLSVIPDIGWPEANAVQLAVDEVNAGGGIGIGGSNYWLHLVTADDGCNPGQGAVAAQALLDAGSVAVVGYTCSGASHGAGALHSAAGVAMISPSSTGPFVTEQGYATTFRVITRDDRPAQKLAAYLRTSVGLERAAIVELDGFWGNWATDVVSETFTALGGTITSRRTIASSDEFTATLTAIQAEAPDVIFYPDDNGDRAGLLSLVADGLGMADVIIAWTTFTADKAVLDAYAARAGSAAEGDDAAMFYRSEEDMPGYGAFYAAYQAAGFPNYGDVAPFYAAFAYDAARIVVASIERAQSTDPADIRDAIAATAGFHGVVGLYHGFDAKGDVIPQWFWLVHHTDGQWRVLYPARVYLPLVFRNY